MLPLVTAIEEVQPNQYQVQAALVAGPITGRLSASLQIENENPSDHFDVTVRYQHLLGNVFGDFSVSFHTIDKRTTIAKIKGEVVMTRLLKAVAYKIQPETISGLTRQFFTRMETMLETNNIMPSKYSILT